MIVALIIGAAIVAFLIGAAFGSATAHRRMADAFLEGATSSLTRTRPDARADITPAIRRSR